MSSSVSARFFVSPVSRSAALADRRCSSASAIRPCRIRALPIPCRFGGVETLGAADLDDVARRILLQLDERRP
jgi:hypothetical protein